MKRIIGVLIISAVWLGCKPGVPKDIIKADKMEKILYDIHIVDGYLANIPTNDSVKKVAAAYYDGVYKKFDVDSATYNKSLNYYYSRPEDLDKIYANIQSKIKGQVKVLNRIDSLSAVARSRALSLENERKEDALKVNVGYNLEEAEKGLYLARYKDIGSKNYVPFDVRKLKKNFDYKQAPIPAASENLPAQAVPASGAKEQEIKPEEVPQEIKEVPAGTVKGNKKTGGLL